MTTTPREAQNLKLSVSNFGPIAKAEIDLRPLTVFVGPSNTGKSYLAILLYALHQCNNNYQSNSFSRRSTRTTDFPDFTESFMTDLIDWVEQIPSATEPINSLEDSPIPVPIPIATELRPLLRDRSNFGNMLREEIERCFGIEDKGRLTRHGSRGTTEVTLDQQVSAESESFRYKLTMNRRGVQFDASIPDGLPLYINGRSRRWLSLRLSQIALIYRRSLATGRRRELLTANLVDRLLPLFDAYILGPLGRVAYYLPSDRTGVMHAHRVAVSSVIERASHAGLQRDRPVPLLSGVLADFLTGLIELSDASSGESEYLATQIEEDLLSGSIHADNSATDYPVFSYQPRGWKETGKMSLMNTSSMVSELAPVVLYLRYIIEPGEVLIIEEPESHLHPAMQVEFIRLLAAAVRSGIRIVITTHSEWVLEELANLVRLSQVPKADRKGIGGADFALSEDQVGVWLFEPKLRPKGSVVKEIPLDVEFGGFRSEFDRVAIDTYNDWAEVSRRIPERLNQ